MADPISAGIIIATTVASTAMAAKAASDQATQQSKAYQYQADTARQQGLQASNAAAQNEATSIRQSGGELGEQAAAAGQANIGTGGSVAQVEHQSRANARLDALNIWYGGELERRQAFNEANLLRYNSLIEKRNADAALIGGGLKAGTQIATGVSQYRTGGLSGLVNPGYGGSGGSTY